MYLRLKYVLPSLVVLALALPISAQSFNLSITNGGATFAQTATPIAEVSTGYSGTFTATGVADTLFNNWMYYRVAGDTRERPFGNYTKSDGGAAVMTGGAAANIMNFNFTETDAGGGTRFTTAWTSTLTEPASGQASLGNSLVFSNPNATPLSMSIYHYIDYDIPTSSGTNTAVGGLPGITITGVSAFTTHTPFTPATAFQVNAFSTLRTALNDALVTNLANTGLPFGPGDYTGAFQWDFTIPGNGSITIDMGMGINTVAVPEPAMLALAGMSFSVAAVYGHRRWKTRKRNRFKTARA